MNKFDFLLCQLFQLVTVGSELAMVFGGVMPYIPQYLQIQSKQTTQGFSMFVCLALLMANTLRIIFWFGNHFETPLLIQSILMNLTMFALIHLCVKINNKEFFAEKRKGRHFTDFDPDYFWRWTDFLSYLEFVMCIALLGKIEIINNNYVSFKFNQYQLLINVCHKK